MHSLSHSLTQSVTAYVPRNAVGHCTSTDMIGSKKSCFSSQRSSASNDCATHARIAPTESERERESERESERERECERESERERVRERERERERDRETERERVREREIV